MKKIIGLGFALCMTSTAALADLTQGDGTYLPQKEVKSSLTRSAVLAKTQSTDIANSGDGTIAPAVAANSKVSRSEVVKKMESFQYADFGDGTSTQPWVKKNQAPSSLATDSTGNRQQASN